MPVSVRLTLVFTLNGPVQGSGTRGAVFGWARGEDEGGFAVPMWVRKVHGASSGYCNIAQQVWVDSRAQWLPMDFIENETQRDMELHRRVVLMDCEGFRTHSASFYKFANLWMN